MQHLEFAQDRWETVCSSFLLHFIFQHFLLGLVCMQFIIFNNELI